MISGRVRACGCSSWRRGSSTGAVVSGSGGSGSVGVRTGSGVEVGE